LIENHKMTSDLNAAISLMNQASSRTGAEALKLLDQADLRIQNAIAADPSNARIFLYWGHLHKQRAQILTTLGNVAEAEEQRRIAIDMYDAALKSDSTLVEAKMALNEMQGGERVVTTNLTSTPTFPSTSTSTSIPAATPTSISSSTSTVTATTVVPTALSAPTGASTEQVEISRPPGTDNRPAYRSGTYTTQSYSQPVHYNLPASVSSGPKVVIKTPQTSSLALLKKEEAAVLQELSPSSSSSGPKVCRYCNTPASGSKFCSNCGEILTV
jgi:hypothetical protein